MSEFFIGTRPDFVGTSYEYLMKRSREVKLNALLYYKNAINHPVSESSANGTASLAPVQLF